MGNKGENDWAMGFEEIFLFYSTPLWENRIYCLINMFSII